MCFSKLISASDRDTAVDERGRTGDDAGVVGDEVQNG